MSPMNWSSVIFLYPLGSSNREAGTFFFSARFTSLTVPVSLSIDLMGKPPMAAFLYFGSSWYPSPTPIVAIWRLSSSNSFRAAGPISP